MLVGPPGGDADCDQRDAAAVAAPLAPAAAPAAAAPAAAPIRRRSTRRSHPLPQHSPPLPPATAPSTRGKAAGVAYAASAVGYAPTLGRVRFSARRRIAWWNSWRSRVRGGCDFMTTRTSANPFAVADICVTAPPAPHVAAGAPLAAVRRDSLTCRHEFSRQACPNCDSSDARQAPCWGARNFGFGVQRTAEEHKRAVAPTVVGPTCRRRWDRRRERRANVCLPRFQTVCVGLGSATCPPISDR